MFLANSIGLYWLICVLDFNTSTSSDYNAWVMVACCGEWVHYSCSCLLWRYLIQ